MALEVDTTICHYRRPRLLFARPLPLSFLGHDDTPFVAAATEMRGHRQR